MNETKIRKVKEALCQGQFLTSLSAYELCKTTRLAAIVFDLRQQGMPIVTVMRENKNGERYGEYHLDTSVEYKMEELYG